MGYIVDGVRTAASSRAAHMTPAKGRFPTRRDKKFTLSDSEDSKGQYPKTHSLSVKQPLLRHEPPVLEPLIFASHMHAT